MFRVANDEFKEVPELNELASFVLTEVIKTHMEPFFYEGWDLESPEDWENFIDEDLVLCLISSELEEEFEIANLDCGKFFARKIAQMMRSLISPEQITFDLLGEYLFAGLIQYYNQINFSPTIPSIEPILPRLNTLLFDYFKTLEIEDQEMNEEDRMGYDAVTDSEKALRKLTQFKNFFLTPEEDSNFVFWDEDYCFIDEWGLGPVLYQCQSGCLAQRGYGGTYVDDMLKGLT